MRVDTEGRPPLRRKPAVTASVLGSPHARPPTEVAAGLGVDPERGLSQAEAAHRLEEAGPNELAPPERPSLLAMVWGAATEPFILMLLGAGVLAVLLGEALAPAVAAQMARAMGGPRLDRHVRRKGTGRGVVPRNDRPVAHSGRSTSRIEPFGTCQLGLADQESKPERRRPAWRPPS